MTDDQIPGGRRTIALSLAIVVLAGVFGGVLGAVVSRQTGLEAATVAAITFTVSPGSFALYGVVAAGTFLVTGLGVVVALSRFDDGEI
ncbi:hypothetical protein OB955_17785 [Halobacteria archaeon AArc-m2/3/4]|uniref:Cox cluster protein n=1 Tax=Natronoglomus mannanivorans TaxID=2979990 RepID=A0AAP3E2A4_9EURY|nr:hypothetical protein [Halobacteria archaeon AArc-xg1-1]MCU4974574.1 hypothetical protein [Halobacteria archaeon AArc-m2/3/4]